jgi:hypothetical protein
MYNPKTIQKYIYDDYEIDRLTMLSQLASLSMQSATRTPTTPKDACHLPPFTW